MRRLAWCLLVVLAMTVGCASEASPPVGRGGIHDTRPASVSKTTMPSTAHPASSHAAGRRPTSFPAATPTPTSAVTPPNVVSLLPAPDPTLVTATAQARDARLARTRDSDHVIRTTLTTTAADRSTMTVHYLAYVKGNRYRVEMTYEQTTLTMFIDLAEDEASLYLIDEPERIALQVGMDKVGLSRQLVEEMFQVQHPEDHGDWQYLGREEARDVLCDVYQREDGRTVTWYWIDASSGFTVRRATKSLSDESTTESVLEEVRLARNPDHLFTPPAGWAVVDR